MNDINKAATPWHLWAVGVIGLLWNAMGALDYVMTQTRNEEYMSSFTQVQLDYFYSFPAWVIACWAIAVWGGVIGCLCLLLRKSIAVHVFLASLIAMVITTIHNFALSDGMEVMGDAFSLVFSGVIFLVSVALYYYAKAQHAAGVLN